MSLTREQMEKDFPQCTAFARFVRDECGLECKLVGAQENGKFVGRTVRLDVGESPSLYSGKHKIDKKTGRFVSHKAS